MPHTILVVDDSPTAGPELRALLEAEGYTVLTALRAEEALDMMRNDRIDLAIVEALLPGMDGFELVSRIRDAPRNASLPIIMLTVRSTTEDYTAGFEAGVNEYFVKPMDPHKIIAATRGLLVRHDLGKLDRPALPRAAAAVGPVRSERGQILTVFSLKGGVGTTTIAVNLAVAIKQAAPSARVGIIDLSLEEGHAALILDVVATSTIAEWAAEDLTQATPYLLNQYFVQHRSGVSLLSAPTAPEQAETVRPDVVRITLDLAPQAFDFVIVDTPASFSEISLIALEQANTILLPVTPDMSALKSTVSTLRILKAVSIEEDRIRVLLNEIVPRAGLTREQMESSLGKPVSIIPHAGAQFVEAANQGMAIVAVQPAMPAARAIIDLARELCEPEVDVTTEARPSVATIMGRLEQRLQRMRRPTS